MKVLLTHEIFPPQIHGGGEIVVAKMAELLSERGIGVKVLTTGDPKIKEYNNIETIRIPVNRYLMNLAYPSILKHARDCDIIQTNNYNACFPSLLAAKTLRKPIVCLVHGMYGNRWFDMRGPLFGGISKKIEAFQIKHDFNKIIFLSEYARKAGIEVGIKKEITEVVKPGVPRNFKSYKVGKKEPFVLFVGRLAKQKGIKYLIEAARKIPNTKFILVGREEDDAHLKETAPNNVVFKGFVSDQELLDLYSRALVFCLPSIGETFGLVLLEAMASGCAVVSTVPLDYYGERVDIKDSEALKDAINKIIRNEKNALQIGMKNRKLASEYNWKNFIDRVIKIYEDLI